MKTLSGARSSLKGLCNSQGKPWPHRGWAERKLCRDWSPEPLVAATGNLSNKRLQPLGEIRRSLPQGSAICSLSAKVEFCTESFAVAGLPRAQRGEADEGRLSFRAGIVSEYASDFGKI
jgi:hypothetical protein